MLVNRHKEYTQHFPSTVDLNITGRCQLDCAFCWGPEHNGKENNGLVEWKELVIKLKSLGTNHIVITGGEPLLMFWLSDFIKFIKCELNMHITLSTNGILLKKKSLDILPYIDELGIPLDGPSDSTNKLLRIGSFPHFDIVLDAIRFIQANFHQINITLRTVVAKKNLDFISQIGKIITQAEIDLKKIRWKLYQINPIGPRKKNILSEDWLVSLDEFNNIIEKIKNENPNINNIYSQTNNDHIGRYFMIFPDGESHIINKGQDSYPLEKKLGNILKNFDLVINNFRSFTKSDNHENKID